MDESFLYKQIAEEIRQEILEGKRKPGDKLLAVRKMTEYWNCTPGTVQRAYKILALQGLVVSRPGQGTRVSDKPETDEFKPLRRATLVNKAENFLLESLSAGYSQNEIELALRMALDRWRILNVETEVKNENVIRFAGSNDVAISWIAAHFNEIIPGFELKLQFGGSLSGLIALSEGKTDIAGCHLWDEANQDYNYSYVERILPGKKVALVTMAHRQLGLIVPVGNPQKIHGLKDLTNPDIQFINRQAGSGTRVWLDSRLKEQHIRADTIPGYIIEKQTHTDVARSIVEGYGTVGIGLQAAAYSFDLDFIPLTREQFEFAILEENLKNPEIKKFVEWLSGKEARIAIGSMSGYDTLHSGHVRWIQ